jgi:hypothetical protein
MDYASRNIVEFPRQRRGAGDVDLAFGAEKVVFHQRVIEVEASQAVYDVGVPVIIRVQRRGSSGPYAVVVF